MLGSGVQSCKLHGLQSNPRWEEITDKKQGSKLEKRKIKIPKLECIQSFDLTMAASWLSFLPTTRNSLLASEGTQPLWASKQRFR